MPATAQASQVNDANKADQDSPFALLMAASAPKQDKPAREQNDAEKPANDQASAAAQPAKPQARPESKSESKSESKPKAKTDGKTKPDEDKTAENGDQDKKEEVAVANDNAAPATQAQPVATNPVPPPALPLVVIADAAEQPATAEASAVQDVAPIAATAPTPDLAALTAAQAAASKDAAPQTAPETATPTPPVSESPSPVQQAAASQPSVPQTSVSEPIAPQNSAPQIVAPPVALPQNAIQQAVAAENTPAQEAPAQETLVQIAALRNTVLTKTANAGERSDAPAPQTGDASVKTDTGKPVAHGAPDEKADGKDIKPDAAKPEIVKTDSAKPDMAQPATAEPAATKSAPQVQAPPNTNMAPVHASTAAQPPQAPAALPGMPQQVQVSAEAAKPNMPALAIEITAKSQSGAKQFDIRLDPPELGRVEIRLSIDAAGKASAHLSADQPQTLDLLQKDAASLTRALRDAGLNVSQDGLNFSLRQQSHDGNGAGQGQARHVSRGMALIATNSIEATPVSATWRGDGRLDIRV